jgi:hypothetical protein
VPGWGSAAEFGYDFRIDRTASCELASIEVRSFARSGAVHALIARSCFAAPAGIGQGTRWCCQDGVVHDGEVVAEQMGGRRDRCRSGARAVLLRRGLWLEYVTLGWNVVGCVVLAITAVAAGSVALAGFGIDSLIEILASMVVVWQLRSEGQDSRTRRALRVIAGAFALLALYIAVESTVVLAGGDHPGRSVAGALWLAVTAIAMFLLAYGKADTGRRLNNLVLRTEARITLVDGALATAVLIGVVLNAIAAWWWADPIAALVLVVYGGREAAHAWREATAIVPGGRATSGERG